MEVPVQVNGKLRDVIKLAANASQAEIGSRGHESREGTTLPSRQDSEEDHRRPEETREPRGGLSFSAVLRPGRAAVRFRGTLRTPHGRRRSVREPRHLRFYQPGEVRIGQAHHLGMRAGVEGDVIVFGQLPRRPNTSIP